jgi:hypothetical protein
MRRSLASVELSVRSKEISICGLSPYRLHIYVHILGDLYRHGVGKLLRTYSE